MSSPPCAASARRPTVDRARRPRAATLLALAAAALAGGACGGDDDDPAVDAGEVDARPTEGRLALRWSLTDPDGAALDCADVDGASVRIVAVPLDGLEGFVESFACATGAGEGSPRGPGPYRLEIDLRSSEGDSLLAAPVEVARVDVVAGQVADAGEVGFAVEPRGAVRFRFDIPGVDSTCGAADDGGAGVVAVGFALAQDGACVDGAALTIAAGAGGGNVGTYTTDCAAPPTFGCIEADQRVELAARASGRYDISIVAYRAGEGGGDPVACFARDAALTVPGNDLVAEAGTLRLVRAADPACAEAP